MQRMPLIRPLTISRWEFLIFSKIWIPIKARSRYAVAVRDVAGDGTFLKVEKDCVDLAPNN